jgi:cyclase
MSTTKVTSELSEIGNGLYAYVASSGTWGWSNAGLVTSGESSLLVDTLFTVGLTREMLDAMSRAVPAAGSIDVLVNSHADGDHTWGNQLLSGAQIIATTRAAEDMVTDLNPEQVNVMMANTSQMGVAGEFLNKIFGPFDFSGIDLTVPTETFTGTLDLTVGDKAVQLIDVGPAHSRGDLIVSVPGDRVAFVADLLFVGGHPAVWAGPISKWIEACDRIIALDAEVIVPGHGPLTDNDGVREFRDYLSYVQDEAIRLHGLGRTVDQAAREIDLSPYASWTDAERIIVAIDTMYRELNGDTSPRNRNTLFAGMGELALGRTHAAH